MTFSIDDFCQFLSACPTAWHVAQKVGEELAQKGFTFLDPLKKWELKPKGRYYTICEGSIAAFVLPKNPPKKMAIAAAHTDSPALKLKPSEPIKDEKNLHLFGIETYGSPILPSFANRDLALAGKVIVEKNGKVEDHLVFLNDQLFLFPLVAPHLDRKAYKEGFVLNPQEQILPLGGLKKEGETAPFIETILKKKIDFSKLIDFELFFVPIDPPRFLGLENELLSSYRLDNLASAYPIAQSIGVFGDKDPQDTTLPIALLWDHEEIGSKTTKGALSPFFTDLYKRIITSYKLGIEEEILLRNHSLCLSCDLTHAFYAPHKQFYDKANSPILGGGVAIKYEASRRYATCIQAAASALKLFEQANLKAQKSFPRSDLATGSTIGPLFATQMGIDTADIGLSQLSMHAAKEVIATSDYLDLCTLLTHFFEGGK